jgi:PAS domain S-box-containing protein
VSDLAEGRTIQTVATELLATHEQLELILRNAGEGVTISAPDGRFLYANETAARLIGVESAEALLPLGRDVARDRFEIFSPDGSPMSVDDLPGQRAFASGEPHEAVVAFRPADGGTERVSVVRAVPVLDEDGAVQFVISFFREVTEERRRVERESFLAEAGALLGESLAYQATLRAVAELAVPRLADFCTVDVFDDAGALQRIAAAYANETTGAATAELNRLYPPTRGDARGPGAVARTGRAELIAHVHDADLAALARDERQLELLRMVGARAVVSVPLTARGRVLGAITLGLAAPNRRLDELDVELAEDLARRASAAIDNATLLHETRRSEALLETLIANAPVGLGFWDRELRYVRVNRALAAMNGPSPEEHVGRHLDEVVPQLRGQLENVFRRVIETGEPEHDVDVSGETPAQPGVRRSWLGSYYPVRGDDGELVGMGAVVMETTERRRSDQRLRLQHAVTRIFTEADSAADAIPLALHSICELLEWDVGAYWHLEPGEDEATCEFIYAKPGLDEFAAATCDHDARRGVGLAGEIWERAEPSWIADVRTRADFPQAEAAAALGIRTGFGFPATISGDVVGILEFFARDQREPDAELLEVAGALGRTVGQFIQRQRLFVREQEARAQAERAASTLRKLAQVTEAALANVSLRDLLDTLLAQIVDVLGADTGAILLLDERGRELTVRAAVGLDEALPLARPIPLGEGLAGGVAASRRSLLVDNLDEVDLVSPVLRVRGVKSLVAIPLIVEDHVIGVVHAGSTAVAFFAAEDARLLELIADRIALAINQSTLAEAEHASRERLAFLAEASALLASALDAETALERLGSLVVGSIADSCSIHLVDEHGLPRLVTIAHAEAARAASAHAYAVALTPHADAPHGVSHVVRTGQSELWPIAPRDLVEGAAADAAGFHSCLIVPLSARGRTLGALALVRAETPTPFTNADLEFAEDLGRRAGVAVDNAQLYREAAERAQAARVLAAVGDGVMLVDRAGMVRYWNRAAAAITGLSRAQVADRPVAEAIPGWAAVDGRIPISAEGTANPRAESLPLALVHRELWLSISGVLVVDGVVYAFRDLTEERALDEMKTEFVSTVSHELRTPLAAIYGAAMTLRRPDVALDEDQRDVLLTVISNEADRLARTVNDILYASRIDTDTLKVAIESCNALVLATDVVDAQRAHLRPGIEVQLVSQDPLPRVAADPDKVRQVLVNLVENAVKYSPDGGHVVVRLTSVGTQVRFVVGDEGLGIPYAEQRRIFEKFYRVDPNMTRGIGGTGLGLYICRELVRRMHGRIWVESDTGLGSTFTFELPIAGTDIDVSAHLRRIR